MTILDLVFDDTVLEVPADESTVLEVDQVLVFGTDGGGGGAVDSVDGLTGVVVLPSDAAAGTGSKRTLGTGGTQAAAGNDSRLSDARTPTAHAASHGSGQSDAVTLAESQVTGLVSDLAAKAPLASPALTGTPTVPTAAPGTNTTQAASTAFVGTAITALSTVYQALNSNLTTWATKTPPSGAAVGTTDTQTLTNKTLTSPAITTPTGLVKGDVGLGNVDNTSDATKNAAAVTLTNKTLTAPVVNSPTGIVKGDVGLGSVDNTADTAKPVSTAQQTALDLKANLASPTFTGTPAAPSAAQGTNTTQVATTAMVQSEVTLLAPKASPTLTGTPVVPTAGGGTNTTQAASTAFVHGEVATETSRATTAEALLAPLASPALTGTPTAPTQTAGNNTTRLATTAFVTTAVAGGGGGSADKLGLTPTAVKTANYTAAAGDYVPCDTTSGGFTVTLPTAPADGTVVGIKHVIQGSTNVVTYATGGSDVINKASGVTSGTLPLLAQAAVLQYKSSSAIWYVVTTDVPLAQTDLRYAPLGTLTTTTKTADYTLALGDAGTVVEMSSASGHWITVPKNASVAFPTGTIIYVRRVGAGTLGIIPADIFGTQLPTLNGDGTSSVAIGARWGLAKLHKVGTDAWDVNGDIGLTSVFTEPSWSFAGQIIVGTGSGTATLLSKGSAGQKLGVKGDASTLEYQSTVRTGYVGPTATSVETIPGTVTFGNIGLLSSGRVSLQPIWLDAGQVVNSISWLSAATALGSGTNQWFALTDASYLTLAKSADDTSTAWAANTMKTLNMTAAYTATTSGVFYVAVMVAATTVPTLRGFNPSAGVSLLAVRGNTGLTTPPTVGTNLATGPTAASNYAYAVVQ